MFRYILLLGLAVPSSFARPDLSTPFPACNNSPSLCNRGYSTVTHLGAHDSPFVSNSSNGFTISGNQYIDSIAQLNAGVRLLSAQIHLDQATNQLHLCHTLCSLYDAGTLESWLTGIKAWMDSHPNEVVTILLVNEANAVASQVAGAYTNSGIIKYAFAPIQPVTIWPAISTFISAGSRLVTFITNLSDNAGASYLLSEFNYIFENPYEVTSPTNFSCLPDRPGSLKGNSDAAIASGKLFLMNHFLGKLQAFSIIIPDRDNANTTNSPDPSLSGSLGAAVQACSMLYGRAPTFVLADWVNIGPAITTVDGFNNVTDAVGRTDILSTGSTGGSIANQSAVTNDSGKGSKVEASLIAFIAVTSLMLSR